MDVDCGAEAKCIVYTHSVVVSSRGGREVKEFILRVVGQIEDNNLRTEVVEVRQLFEERRGEVGRVDFMKGNYYCVFPLVELMLCAECAALPITYKT